MEARDEIVDNFFNCNAGEKAPLKVDSDEKYYIDMWEWLV